MLPWIIALASFEMIVEQPVFSAKSISWFTLAVVQCKFTTSCSTAERDGIFNDT